VYFISLSNLVIFLNANLNVKLKPHSTALIKCEFCPTAFPLSHMESKVLFCNEEIFQITLKINCGGSV
jgi:hypothetical protein